MKHYPITVLGLPLGTKTLAGMTQANKEIAEADILCAYKKTLALVGQNTKKSLTLGVPLDASLPSLRALWNDGAKILVLALGDPLFFGIGSSLAAHFQKHDLRILPTVSSLQAACARLALPWANVRTISLHGRNLKEALHTLNQALLDGSPICLLTDKEFSQADIAAHLTAKHYACTMHVFTGLGTEEESHSIWRIPGDCPESPTDLPVTILLEPEQVKQPLLGIADSVFQKRTSCFTRRPVRAVALSYLALKPQDILWDIGAGSGALSIEAASLLAKGAIYAIEERAERIAQIKELLKDYPIPIINPVAGHAPDALIDLPDPNAVFIGGGLAHDAQAILEAASTRLTPGGRLVASCVLLSSLLACTQFFAEQNWPSESILLQTAEAKALSIGSHYTSANPVYLVLGTKPLSA
ncbi:MAG: precorrin-6y C5,15-methyltransferase (decarboxylating) subunit CbiE [Desulfovibrionaceae bacterium]|nr:precorrin-6y C5,15-methyltransferase (decarboxylating) subunit CbiE [Desulfovibrionaceae bacterium]